MASHIARKSRKCMPAYSHESHRLESLKRALMKEGWAKPILMEVTEMTSYQQLYIKLANGLQFHEESEEIAPSQSNETKGKPTICFTQPKYGGKLSGKLFSVWNTDKSFGTVTK